MAIGIFFILGMLTGIVVTTIQFEMTMDKIQKERELMIKEFANKYEALVHDVVEEETWKILNENKLN